MVHRIKMPLGLALAFLAGESAFAASMTLVCVPKRPDSSTITIEVDEQRRTVSLSFSGGERGNEPPTGAIAATIDSRLIAFNRSGFNGNTNWYSRHEINRLSGNLSMYYSIRAPWDRAAPDDRLMLTYSCQATKPRF